MIKIELQESFIYF